MANTHKYGFRPVTSLHGESSNPDVEIKTVATGYQAQNDGAGFNVDLRVGDPVKLAADGSITLSITTELVYGIIVGFEPYWDGTRMQPTNRLPGGTAWGTVEERRSQVRIARADSCLWECDFDTTGQPTTTAAWRALEGSNFIHLCVGDQTDTSKPRADPFIDVSSAATTAGLEWRLIQVSRTAWNKDPATANYKGIFMSNASQVAATAATPVVGV